MSFNESIVEAAALAYKFSATKPSSVPPARNSTGCSLN